MKRLWDSRRAFIALVALIVMTIKPEVASFASAVAIAVAGANAFQASKEAK